jgi:hypothetical protein
MCAESRRPGGSPRAESAGRHRGRRNVRGRLRSTATSVQAAAAERPPHAHTTEAALRAVVGPECDSVRSIDPPPGEPPVPVAPSLPEPGQVVEVRGSTWAVANVQAQGLPLSPARCGSHGHGGGGHSSPKFPAPRAWGRCTRCPDEGCRRARQPAHRVWDCGATGPPPLRVTGVS